MFIFDIDVVSELQQHWTQLTLQYYYNLATEMTDLVVISQDFII